MSIKSVFIGAALACTAAQADAATYNAKFKVEKLVSACGSTGDCSHYPPSKVDYFQGLKQGDWGYAHVATSVSEDGNTLDWSFKFGPDLKQSLSGATLYLNDDGTYSYDSHFQHPIYYTMQYIITWSGTSGTWFIATDGGTMDQYVTISYELATVPLPAAIGLLPIGLGALGALRARQRSRATA